MFKPAATLVTALGLIATALPAAANVNVRFVESAPRDRFEIVNASACALVATDVVIDLSGSAAGLIFDTTNTGAGVDVFQPFELVAGADALASHSRVTDGDRQVTLSIRRLAPAARIAFTIDVDDTAGPRGITIAGSEIEGATVRVTSAGNGRSARFSSGGEAVVATPACG
mgnify:CR=1 FL=1